MGAIRQLRSGRTLPLGPRALVGRSPACDLTLSDPKVSAEHAVIWWDRGWWVRDLGSRNGTWTEGDPTAREPRALLRDRSIGFGGAHDPWALIDDTPPPPSASWAGGTVVGAVDLLLLPDAETPEVLVALDGQGRWVIERDGRTRTAMSGEVVEVGDRSFVLLLPESVPATLDAAALTLDAVRLVYRMSRDQEHVQARLILPSGERDLGGHTHHYALAVLAGIRRDDPEPEASERGWILQEELVARLRMRPELFNLHVHRARRQLADEGVRGAEALVERRAGSGQIRFGTDHVDHD